jgi:glucose/mannose transport system substrate-binding protein
MEKPIVALPKREWTLLAIGFLFLLACTCTQSVLAPISNLTSSLAATPPATGSPASTTVEIFSWWTSGSEAAGLQALIDKFMADNPGWNIVNTTTAGGAGTNAQAVLKTRMLGGDPPDSFQIHMGHELIDTYVTVNLMEPLDDVYQANGFNSIFPRGVLDAVSYDGHPWSVPVNIHRSNVLWYNKTVLADNGIHPDDLATFAGWKTAAKKLQAAGVIPLALGSDGTWAAAHLFEDVLLGTVGADKWLGLWNGTTGWKSPEVTQAIGNYKMVLQYVNSDHPSLSWDQAVQYVIDGKAAMTIMGDWTDGEFINKGFNDYGWMASPGTQGLYLALSDSFGLPKGAKNPDGAKRWLAVIGSKAGQEAFNKSKGSICARTDCDYSSFDAYLRSAAADWKVDVFLPSVVHGAAAKDGWKTAFSDGVALFLSGQDAAAMQAGLAQACVDADVCR